MSRTISIEDGITVGSLADQLEIPVTKLKINGMVTGNINCWVSVSLSTAEPMAANMEL